MRPPRAIPSLERLLERPQMQALSAKHGHAVVVRSARAAAAALRATLARRGPDTAESPAAQDQGGDAAAAEDLAAALEQTVAREIGARFAPSLRPVINATGVILHTNLGRAPLGNAAIEAIGRLAGGYTNLEYDLAEGRRGHRDRHAERLVSALTGAESALVTNNNAAAMLVSLAALAPGREVIVSRGELVEIGGGFRVPDILSQSGASLREVGTTNRTRVSDYGAAISDRTGLILRVHPSNFRIEGFTERPPLGDIVALGREFRIPVIEDLGSGWLGLDAPGERASAALADEPSVLKSLEAGVDLVAFSGDKLLGGPQAGILAGRLALIEVIRRHPLMRAVRASKLTYAALEATLTVWATPARHASLPVLRMLTLDRDDIDRRAARLASGVNISKHATARVIDGASTIGGGSAPGSAIPTRLLCVQSRHHSAAGLETRLRRGKPPVIARAIDDEVVLDLRTVDEQDDQCLLDLITQAAERTV